MNTRLFINFNWPICCGIVWTCQSFLLELLSAVFILGKWQQVWECFIVSATLIYWRRRSRWKLRSLRNWVWWFYCIFYLFLFSLSPSLLYLSPSLFLLTKKPWFASSSLFDLVNDVKWSSNIRNSIIFHRHQQDAKAQITQTRERKRLCGISNPTLLISQSGWSRVMIYLRGEFISCLCV